MILLHKIYFSLYPSKKTVVIYGGEGKEPLLRMAETYAFKKRFIISRVIENPSDFQRVLPLIKGIDCIVTSGLKESVRDDLIMYCSQNDIPAYIIPTTVDVQLRSARRIKSFSGLVLKLSRPYPSWEYFLVKRAFDILFSSFLLLLVIPLFGILALCIKLEDRGPIFYKQIRLTQNGKEFIIYKFRSMKVNAEQDGIARLSTANDDRITKTGRIIRRLRIDELPQLINVLRGDMSVVGPRPERPEIASESFVPIPLVI